jgi:hypothetical protein
MGAGCSSVVRSLLQHLASLPAIEVAVGAPPSSVTDSACAVSTLTAGSPPIHRTLAERLNGRRPIHLVLANEVRIAREESEFAQMVESASAMSIDVSDDEGEVKAGYGEGAKGFFNTERNRARESDPRHDDCKAALDAAVLTEMHHPDDGGTTAATKGCVSTLVDLDYKALEQAGPEGQSTVKPLLQFVFQRVQLWLSAQDWVRANSALRPLVKCCTECAQGSDPPSMPFRLFSSLFVFFALAALYRPKETQQEKKGRRKDLKLACKAMVQLLRAIHTTAPLPSAAAEHPVQSLQQNDNLLQWFRLAAARGEMSALQRLHYRIYSHIVLAFVYHALRLYDEPVQESSASGHTPMTAPSELVEGGASAVQQLDSAQTLWRQRQHYHSAPPALSCLLF